VEDLVRPRSRDELVGPTGITSPVARIDFREGGTSLVSMRSPEGQDLYNIWTYGKIVPMQLIECINTP
jgi:uncharacterized protein YndB with AHSA1/START domain